MFQKEFLPRNSVPPAPRQPYSILVPMATLDEAIRQARVLYANEASQRRRKNRPEFAFFWPTLRQFIV